MSYFRGNNVKTKKEIADHNKRITNTYNRILKQINSVETIQEYTVIRDNIDTFSKIEGVGVNQIQELNSMLLEHLNGIVEESEAKQEKLNEEISNIRKQRYHESSATAKELREQSERRMFDFFLELGQNRTEEGKHINKRRLGNYVKEADRIDAIALSRLSIMDEFKDLFTPKQLSILLNKSKSELQKTFEKNQQEQLQRKEHELSVAYMDSFKFKKAVAQMEKQDSMYYGGDVS